ncbi:MAG: hypothetical protein ACYDDF_14405 [Thermoplasmatota archaeon]
MAPSKRPKKRRPKPAPDPPNPLAPPWSWLTLRWDGANGASPRARSQGPLIASAAEGGAFLGALCAGLLEALDPTSLVHALRDGGPIATLWAFASAVLVFATVGAIVGGLLSLARSRHRARLR